MANRKRRWLKALSPDELPEGRVKSVTCAKQTVCMTHFEGQYTALDNKCPHQGGPLGEGSIENGWLRCPWHGWDFHPQTGRSPGAHDDGVEVFPTEVRDDGIYVGIPEEDAHVRTTSDVMAETMHAWGVRWVFGMVGHSNLGMADALHRQEDAGQMRFIGIRHEGAGAFAASAYGKLMGKPAACFTIAGPGATNLLTGLWDAHVDGAPLLALTGQVPTKLIGRGAFQEVDLEKAFGGVAAYKTTVWHGGNHAEQMSLACKHAIVDSGVAHVVLPDDVQVEPAEEVAAGAPSGRVGAPEIRPPREVSDEAMALIREAERPAIIVGHGARFVMDDVVALAEKLGAPVLTTFKGKGLISDQHPLGCGVLGRSGTPIASWFMNEADLLIVLGASFSNHTGITPKLPTIQVDYDRMRLGRFHPVTVPVWGEIGVTAREWTAALGEVAATERRAEISERWGIWRDEKKKRLDEKHGDGPGLHSAAIFEAMTRHVAKDAVIALDVGNNTYSFGRYFECDDQRIIMSGYLGSIGFGYSAAMGAWCATQEADSPVAGRQVVCVSGDGGFGQYMGEYLTAVKYGMNITHVLVNNGELGKISKEQRAGDYEVWKTGLHNPDFAQYAELCGAKGFRVESVEQLDKALAAALAHDGPSTVEIIANAMLI